MSSANIKLFTLVLTATLGWLALTQYVPQLVPQRAKAVTL